MARNITDYPIRQLINGYVIIHEPSNNLIACRQAFDV